MDECMKVKPAFRHLHRLSTSGEVKILTTIVLCFDNRWSWWAAV